MSSRIPRIVWLVLSASLALKLIVVRWTRNIQLILDESNYVEHAQFLLEHGHLPGAFRPPVYPMFVAFCQLIGGNTATPVRVGHALVSTAAGLILYRWLRTHTGHRGALLSTTLWCMYPILIGYTHLLWSETIFLSMLIFFFATALPAGELSTRRTVFAAALFALASLTRSVLLPLLPIAPIFVLLHTKRWTWRPKRWSRLALFWGTAAMLIVPWSVHNRIVEGRWIINETTHGYNLWKGNTPWAHPYATEGPQYPGPIVSIPMFPYEGSGERLTDLCARDVTDEPYTHWHVSQCAQRLAIDHIIDDPLLFLARGPKKLGTAFHPGNLLQRHLWLGKYGEPASGLQRTLIWGTTLPYFAMLAVIGFAIRRVPRTPMNTALFLVALYQAAVIFITFGNTRFRLPIIVVGMIFAAWLPARASTRTD